MKDKLDHYIDGLRYLPPRPTLLVELTALFKQPHYDVDQVVHLMSLDPSLTAEILKRCNSTFFAGEEPVVDMFDAVLRLGFYEVYRLVVVMASARLMTQPGAGHPLSAEALWQHSAATAVAAGVVAGELREPEGAAFTAGLLHDVGKIIFMSGGGSEYSDLMRQVGTDGPVLSTAEREKFGFDHGAVGARLLARWDLPAEIVVPVGYHHQLVGAGPFERQAAIVNLADAMAHCLEEGPRGAARILPGGAEALAVLQLSQLRVAVLLERTKAGMGQVEGMAGQSSEPVPPA